MPVFRGPFEIVHGVTDPGAEFEVEFPSEMPEILAKYGDREESPPTFDISESREIEIELDTEGQQQ